MSTVIALVVPVEGPITEIELDPDASNLKTLQAAVGGYIEAVAIPSFISCDDQATAYVNEEGKLLGLPVNRRATDFFVPAVGLFWGDYIAGPLVLAGFDPETGEYTALPKTIIHRIRLIEKEA